MAECGAHFSSRGATLNRKAYLLLEDGRRFDGELIGAGELAFGEVVFNTAMSGYQEILTDPSYTGQLVTMTYPLIGNYGVNATDRESRVPQADSPGDPRSDGAWAVIRSLAARVTSGRRLGRHHGAARPARCRPERPLPRYPYRLPSGTLPSTSWHRGGSPWR